MRATPINAKQVYAVFQDEGVNPYTKFVIDRFLRRTGDTSNYRREAVSDLIDEILHKSKLFRVHWAQWVPPGLISQAPKTLKIRNTAEEPPQTTTQSSLLFKLPVELRIMIYEYAVSSSHEHSPYGDEELPGFLVPKYAQQPALLRICKQLRFEFLPTFYHQNTFLFVLDSAKLLLASHTWLSTIGDQGVAQMQNIVLIGFRDSGYGCA